MGHSGAHIKNKTRMDAEAAGELTPHGANIQHGSFLWNPFSYCNISYIEKACENYVILSHFLLNIWLRRQGLY